MLKNIALCLTLAATSTPVFADTYTIPTPRPAPQTQTIIVTPRPYPAWNGSIVQRPMGCDATPVYPYCDCAAPGDRCVPR